MMTQEQTEWMPLREASRHFRISIHVIKRLIKEHRLEARENILDKREKLINVAQLRRLVEDPPQ